MVCKHCLRTIHSVIRHGEEAWADETNDPFYCPRALNFNHKPQDPTDSAPQ